MRTSQAVSFLPGKTVELSLRSGREPVGRPLTPRRAYRQPEMGLVVDAIDASQQGLAESSRVFRLEIDEASRLFGGEHGGIEDRHTAGKLRLPRPLPRCMTDEDFPFFQVDDDEMVEAIVDRLTFGFMA